MCPARRWVVERTFAWLSRCRAILVRYDKLAERYLATVKLACGLLWFCDWYALDPALTFLRYILKRGQIKGARPREC